MIARRPSLFSRLIEKFATSIKRLINRRREKGKRVEPLFGSIKFWLKEQPRINVEVHRAYQGLEQQLKQTNLNTEKRRIKMKMNVQRFDYNKNKPKDHDLENSIEASLGIK